MENAVDALKMAAAILIFIIALATSFSLFGTAKKTADSIITMRDKQAYLDAAEEDVGGILYTSTETVASNNATGVNSDGYRIVKKDDVISTIYRYNKEKYGVTIIKGKTVIARFDSATESVMIQWYNITDGKEEYTTKIKENISTIYAGLIKNGNKYTFNESGITLNLEDLYYIEVEGNDNIKCGAPWYGNDEEIQRRISKELQGISYSYNGQTYTPKQSLDDVLSGTGQIIEIINEIDESKYLKDENKETEDKTTNLIQQYEMPTVEIIYIIN